MNIVTVLKDNDQDFEWYPTTPEIIESVKNDIIHHFGDYNKKIHGVKTLDCGAGDGRVLKEISFGGTMYAIEKSKILIERIPNEIFIVGTEFTNSTLIDKPVDVVFSNPPYSHYEEWTTKIIKESNAKVIYLVIPERWKNSKSIKHAIDLRESEVTSIGFFDFHDAERKARAKVEVISICLYKKFAGYGGRRMNQQIDPFDLWFDENFTFPEPESKKKNPKDITNDHHEIVSGGNLVETLISMHDSELKTLWKNYTAVSNLSYDILKELGVDVDILKTSLKEKIKNLKYRYWKELFDNFDKIKSRLTKKKRNHLIDKLTSNMSVEFTLSNIYAITTWAIKNANQYYDEQLIELVEEMISFANVKMYKSNKRTFGEEDWRYCYGTGPEGLEKYSLELRIILHHKGGINVNEIRFWDFTNGLANSAHDFLSDICTISNNLGYSTKADSKNFEWESMKKCNFLYSNGKILMEVKAFKNGNIHIKFDQNFMRHLNVEFGRLKGWLKNKQEASKELQIPMEEIETSFNSNFKLTSDNILMIVGPENE